MMFSSRASIAIIFRSFIIAGSLLAEFVIAPNSADVLSEEREALQRGALTWPWDLTSTYIHPSHITKNPPGYEDAIRNSYTDLHLSAYGGKKEVIEGLIKPGTDMGAETKDHVKPGVAIDAETKGHIKPGTDIGDETKDHVKPGIETKSHVKPGVDINAKTKDGKTVLSLAVAYGHDKIVKLLLENGASTWMPKDYSYQLSLLDVAVISGNTETVKHLIDTGKFDLNEHLTYAHNITVLHRAVLCPNLEMIKLLISRGADVNYEDINDNTPLYYCTSIFHKDTKIEKEIANYLRSKGAKGSAGQLYKHFNNINNTGIFGVIHTVLPVAYMSNRTKDNKLRTSLTQKCNLIPAETHSASTNTGTKGA